jgi:hypothetical protein
MEYHHRQFGTVIVAALTAGIVFVNYIFLKSGESFAIQMELMLVLLAAIALFYSLTVEIKENTLILRMGIGLIQKRIPLADVQQARKVRIPWYAGWGIHYVPFQFRVWNVSGRDGVELTLTDGMRFCIGTDEPEALVNAIESLQVMK